MKLNTDWLILRKQKQTLLELASSTRTSVLEQDHLMGLVHFIDWFQDEAVRDGIPEKEIFGEEE